MDKIIKQKWVDALRSGKYKQGKGQLKNRAKYCCLGVLCKVMGMRIISPGLLVLPNDIRDQAKLRNDNPLVIPPERLRTKMKKTVMKKTVPIAALNDGTFPFDEQDALGFNEIADLIEQQL